MKLIIVRKGGSGSGHFDHAGRPGEQGGSLPGTGGGDSVKALYKPGQKVNTENMILDVIRNIKNYPDMYNLLIGLEADGGLPAGENLEFIVKGMVGADAVLEEMDPESAIGEHEIRNKKIYDAIRKEIDILAEEGRHAVDEDGWDDPNNDGKSRERKAWERKYYGKEVGGHKAAEHDGVKRITSYVNALIDGAEAVPPKKMSNNDMSSDENSLKQSRDRLFNHFQIGSSVKYEGREGWNVVAHLPFYAGDKPAVILHDNDSGVRLVVSSNGIQKRIPKDESFEYWDVDKKRMVRL
jgi:hypothetical protein